MHYLARLMRTVIAAGCTLALLSEVLTAAQHAGSDSGR